MRGRLLDRAAIDSQTGIMNAAVHHRFAAGWVGYPVPVTTSRSARRRAAVIAMALALGLLASACRSEDPVGGTKVLLVGDSIMNGSRAKVMSTLESDGWQPDIEAQGGTTITYWSMQIPYLVLMKQPDVVVIELGTNDCAPTECPALGPYIDEIMRGIPTSTPVLWLNIQEKIPLAQKRKYINFEIESAVARWPNLHLVDYESRIENHPEYHTPGGLHLNDVGQQFLANLIRDALTPFKPPGT
jgi:lysophospholipase L1-like esterase